jgi:integrative and conjugative element protein (TIGR02256 family)
MPGMRSALIWHSPYANAGKILIEAEPLTLMDGYRQDSPGRPESGGILLGYRRGEHLHVTMATAPQKSDRGWRNLFKRSARYHQEIALREWNSSDKTIDYLGEWHTHPQHLPNPSAIDLIEWRKICSLRKSSMTFLIIGWNGELWLGLSRGLEIERCPAISI